jgi:hypothetical protein
VDNEQEGEQEGEMCTIEFTGGKAQIWSGNAPGERASLMAIKLVIDCVEHARRTRNNIFGSALSLIKGDQRFSPSQSCWTIVRGTILDSVGRIQRNVPNKHIVYLHICH